MATIFRFVLSCLIALSIPIGSSATDNVEHRKRLSKHYCLEKPEGQGLFPAVMLVSGCNGFDSKFMKARYDRVQSLLVESGFVTLRVNYLAARNVSTCWPEVPPEEVAGDIRIAAEHLRQKPFVKQGAINVLGWSWGGAGALLAIGHTDSREPAPIDAVVAYYPSCFYMQRWDSEVPVLVLVGAIDNIAPFSDCEKLFGKLSKPHKVIIRVYDNAHHCFDNSDLPAEMKKDFGTIGYNKTAAESAWSEVINFLRK